MNTIKTVIIVFAFIWPAGLVAQTKIFVSAKGSGANLGTQAKPFAAIDRALAEARKKSGPVVVYLLEGTYYLNRPIVLTAEDSRKENEELTLTAYKNQEVTISGAVALNLKWKEYKNGIW